MWDRGSAPDQQLTLPFAAHRGAATVGASGACPPGHEERRMDRVVERPHLWRALARGQANGGSLGMDGRTGEERAGDLPQHWPTIRASLLAGTSRPRPGKRVAIPKPGGGVRKLAIPTGLARLLPQALLPVLQPAGAQTCAEGSDGLRPGRSAHQASARAQASLEEGASWVVALEREKCLDRVTQATLMSVGKERGKDRRGWRLLDRSLQAGALTGEGFEATTAGTPQGGPGTLPTKWPTCW